MKTAAKDEELSRLAKEVGSMVFGILMGLIVDYEQIYDSIAGTKETPKLRKIRLKQQMDLTAAAEARIRRVVQFGLMADIVAAFEEMEGIPPTTTVTHKMSPALFQLRIMQKELMNS